MKTIIVKSFSSKHNKNHDLSFYVKTIWFFDNYILSTVHIFTGMPLHIKPNLVFTRQKYTYYDVLVVIKTYTIIYLFFYHQPWYYTITH